MTPPNARRSGVIPFMTQLPSPSLTELVAEAKTVQSQLERLWTDEGVDQLQIFLDPGTASILAEIKEISLTFVRRIASFPT